MFTTGSKGEAGESLGENGLFNLISVPAKINDENIATFGALAGEKRPLSKYNVPPLTTVEGQKAAILNPNLISNPARRNVLGERSINTTTTRNLRQTTGKTVAKSIIERTTLGSEKSVAISQSVSENHLNVNSPIISENPAPESILEHDDLDAEDAEDPLMVSEYVSEIFEYMRGLEKQIAPSPDYMEIQKELNWHSRSVLIDWLIEVQWKLKLLPETLFLSVNIIDRFLARRSVSLVKLQLVGMAATLLASKYEEVLSPSIANFVYLADNAYDEAELLKAERYMLHVLSFSLAYPSPLVFLRRVSKADNYDVRSRTIAKYLMEVCLIDSKFVSCPPSITAAVAIYFARDLLKSGPWSPNLCHYSGGYTESDIRPWYDRLVETLKKPVTYEAVFKKYSLKKLMRASLVVQEYMKRTYNVPPHVPRDLAPSIFDPDSSSSASRSASK